MYQPATQSNPARLRPVLVLTFIVCLYFIGRVASAQDYSGAHAYTADLRANRIAIGQGISSPASTSTVNYGSAFTSESPVGVIYQGGFRLSAEYDRNDDSDLPEGFGAEFGYGTGEWGAAVGHYKRDCSGCDGVTTGAAALNFSDIGLGVKIQEDQLGLGFLFNPFGRHRVGLMVESYDPEGPDNRVTSYGLGYSFVHEIFTLTLDASRRDYEDASPAVEDITLLTPGVGIRVGDMVQISVNDRITLDDGDDNDDDDLWFGVGVGQSNWHLAGYSDYVNDFSLVLSAFF